MHKIVIMGAGRMGSLIRRLAEAARDEAGEPVFEVVAQIGFDLTVELTELSNLTGLAWLLGKYGSCGLP